MSVLIGDSTNNTIDGTSGGDLILAGKGDDTVNAGDGNDRVLGGKGDDTLNGGEGRDTLVGGRGDDELDGGSGNDRLFGGSGHDRLTGGAGNDWIVGGSGFDTAVFSGSFSESTITVGWFGKIKITGPDGVDWLYGVEALEFDDGTVFLDGRNNRPFATDDDGAVDAGEILNVAAGAGLLTNDTDLEGDPLTVTAVEGGGANVGAALLLSSGALVTVAADGSYVYDTNGAFAGLALGETATDTFTYTVSDGLGGTDTATVTITVTGVIVDANEAPTVSLANTLTTLDEDTDTSSRVKVADIVVTDDGFGTNDLSLSGTDAGLFEIDGTELFLKAGTSLDFETDPSLDVTVEVDDAGVGGAPDDMALLSIAVTDVNEAPTVSLANQVANLAEDTDTSSRVKVADIVITDDALGTNNLSLSGADAALFEIDGTELFLKAGTSLDFETDPSLDVTVEVDDAGVGGAPDDTALLSIAIGDINAAPTVALANTVTNLDEDTDTTSRVKVADIVVTDDGEGVNVLSLSGADAGLFEIDGTELFLMAGASLDFETDPSLDVTVEVDDAGVGGTPDDTALLSIAVTDVNEAPTVALANTTTALPEDTDTSSRVKVADIVITDDALGTNGLSLSGADAALFEIDGTELFLKAGTSLDFETAPSLDVTVEVDDAGVGGSPDDTAVLSIAVTDVNEAPTVSLANQVANLAEDTDTSSRIKVADIVVTDDALGTNDLSLSGTDAALFEIDGFELYLVAGAALDFETNPSLDVTVEVDDTSVGATPDDTADLSIAIIDVNEAPTVSLANTLTSLDEDTETSSRIKVADIVIADDALGANNLSLSGTDAALFEIDGTELFLVAGAGLDFETNPSLDVTVEVDDTGVGATPDDTANLSIAIGDINAAPTVALANTVTNLDEDTDTTSRVKVADIVVTDDGEGVNVLSLSGADAGLFEIDGTELFLVAGAGLDFETNPLLDVTVEVDDTSVGTTPDDTANLSIAVGDVNDDPDAIDDNISTFWSRAGNVLADNGLGADSDPEGDPLTVTAVNGVPGNVGSLVTFASGATVTVDADGTYLFDPNGVEDGLVGGQSATESFTYTVSDGQGNTDTATVTVTINGHDPVAAIALSDVALDIDLRGFVINGVDGGDGSGWSVSRAGDVNGDGIDDVIVGANLADPGGAGNAGESYVVFGATDLGGGPVELSDVANGSGGHVINGAGANDQSGRSVSYIGDMNGDGLSDLIVGAPGAGSGEVYVVFGKSTDTAAVEITDIQAGTGGFVINGEAGVFSEFGAAVSGAGDVNGDGIDDLLISAYYNNTSYVVFGKTSDTAAVEITDVAAGTGGFQITSTSFDYSGISLSGVGDMNGDGFADFIVGSRYANGAHVVFGKAGTAAVELTDIEAGTGGFLIDGAGTGATFYIGVSVSGAGDINGDGIDDVIVGSPFADPGGTSNAGESYVVFGKTDTATVQLSDIALDGDNGGFVIGGIDGNDQSGRPVSAAGDINGDGLQDLIVGAPLADPNGGSSGEVYVVFGKADGRAIDLTAIAAGDGGFVLEGPDGNDNAGRSVSAAGDLNGDGFDDLIVGAPGGDPNGGNSGESYVIYGRDFSIANVPPVAEDDAFSVNNIGTVAGNVLADNGSGADSDSDGGTLAVKAVNGSDADVGSQITLGSGALLTLNSDGTFIYDPNGVFDATPSGQTATDTFSYTLYDGFGGTDTADVTVTIDGTDPIAPIKLSSIATATDLRGLVINGVAAGDDSGFSVSGAGDVNGDGIADVIIGAIEAYGSSVESGASYVVFGKTDLGSGPIELSDIAQGDGGFVLDGIDTGDRAGFSVSGAGDVNNDGIDDLIVGARAADPNGNLSGEAYVVFGSTGLDGSPVALSDIAAGNGGFVINGADANDATGESVSGAGDVNGDGYDDVIVGAVGAQPNGAGSGAAYVVFGGPVTAPIELSAVEAGSGGFVINGIESTDGAGRAVSSLGDVNGDGLDDVLVGAPLGAPGSGAEAYVVFGKTGTATVELSDIRAGSGGFAIEGGSDSLQISVSSAGDVNGDGLTDLIVGIPGIGKYTGESFVMFGREDNTGSVETSDLANGSGGLVITGLDERDRLGISVSSAGDVNGDGIDDLIVGAAFAAPNGVANAGETYVVFGKAGLTEVDLNDIVAGTGGFVINGADPFDRSGRSVSAAGDVNGDGFDDVIIGAYLGDPNGDESGESYIIYGRDFTTANVAPVAGDDTGFATDEDTVLNVAAPGVLANDSDSDGGTLGVQSADTVSAEGAAVTVNIDGSFTYDPSGSAALQGLTAGASVADTFSYVLSDGYGGTDTATVTVNVAGINDPVNAQDDAFTIAEYNIAVGNVFADNGSGADSDADDEPFSVTEVNGSGANVDTQITLGSGALLTLNADGTFAYDPNGQFDTLDEGQTATDTFTYTVADPQGSSDTATVTITINGTVPVLAIELSNIEAGTDPRGLVINGIDAFDESGLVVSDAGDVNGDGLDDVLIAAPFADPNGNLSGETYVVFGATDLSNPIELSDVAAGIGGFVITGDDTGDESGGSVSAAGDVNGDGIDDLIIGADLADPNGGGSGESYIVFGATDLGASPVNLSTIVAGTGGIVINGDDAGDRSGHAVSGAGDVNGDGIDDFVIGAYKADANTVDPNDDDQAGEAYVVFGSTGLTNPIELSDIAAGTGGFMIEGEFILDQAGYAVSGAGDVNGDGLDDLIVSVTGGSGQSYIVFGKSDNTNVVNLGDIEAGTGGFVIETTFAGADGFGRSVSGAGDVNGDGIDDMVFGARYADPNGVSNAGATYVLFGSTDLDGTPVAATDIAAGTGGFVINGIDANDQSGWSVSGAGDVNGDGLADLIIGAPYADPDGVRDVGKTYVVYGKGDGSAIELSTIEAGIGGFVIEGIDIDDYSGFSVSGAGDIDNDGFDDLILSAPGGAPNGTDSGESYIIYGGPGLTAVTLPVAQDDAFTTQEYLIVDGDVLTDNGSGADSDADGDPLSVIEVNGSGANVGTEITLGSGALLTLQSDGTFVYDPNGAFDATPSGQTDTDSFSYTLFDGAFGTDTATVTITIEGSDTIAPIELSSIATATDLRGLVINGVAATDVSGISVSGAGDVNGDGIDDVIIGASAADGGAGESYVVFGKTDLGGGPIELSDVADGTGGFVLKGTDPLDVSGFSVSGAGDVNGDGIDDVVVGAAGGDPNGGESGESYVVFGKSNNTDPVELSAIAAGSGGFVIEGIDGDDQSGYSVSGAGDVNGDGLADVIVGAFRADPNGGESGESYVVFGKSDGSAVELSDVANGTGGFAINGIDGSDFSGTSVSAIGDMNGDGLDDLIVGAPYADPNGADSGESYVVFGKSNGSAVELSAVAAGTGGFAINGIDGDDRSGKSVSGAGDVNGDGVLDVIVGADRADPDGNAEAGESYIVFGKTGTAAVELSDVANGTGGFAINGVDGDDRSGFSVSGAGDVNGDGLADLIVGAPYADPDGASRAGESYVVFGKADGEAVELSEIALGIGGFVVEGIDADDQSGTSVSAAGDVNDDGYDDLIVGAPDGDPNGSNSGESYIIYGQAFTTANVPPVAEDDTGFATDEDTVLNIAAPGVLANDSDTDGGTLGVQSADTVSAEGAAVTVNIDGSFTYDPSGSAALQALPFGASVADTFEYTLSDGQGGTDTATVTVTVNGVNDPLVAQDDAFSTPEYRIAVGDVFADNGSGADSDPDGDPLTVTAVNGAGANVGTQITLGSGALLTLNADGTFAYDPNGQFDGLSGGQTDTDTFTYTVANGQGSSESATVTVTIEGSDPVAPIKLSSIATATDLRGLVINGAAAGDNSGDSVSAAGDVNGDGIDDVIIGASAADGGAGESYVVFGKTDLGGGPIELSDIANGTGGFVINGASGADQSGRSVSGAGDVNGDGLDDLIVGANNSDSSGESYVVFGKSANTNAVALSDVAAGSGGFVINGADASDFSGFSVSSAGDVNGDGIDDVVVGAPAADPSGDSGAGESYVVFGATDLGPGPIELSDVASGTGGFVINGASSGDQSGGSVSGAGDVNGDGLADLIVGADNGDPGGAVNAGESYVVFGKTDTGSVELSDVAAGSGGFVINGIDSNDDSGWSVSGAGDVNGDGLADLVIGARRADPNGSGSGESYVVFGKSGDSNPIELSDVAAGSGGFVINGIDSDDNSGWSVSGAGDVNGDGLADLIVGAPYADPNGVSGAGESYVVFGKADGEAVELSEISLGIGGFVIEGIDADDNAGRSVSAAGDVNDDGYDDLIVGVWEGDPNGSASGESYIIYGQAFTTANVPPVAADDARIAIQNVALEIDVMTNDSDVEGDPLSLDSFTTGSDGVVTRNDNGTPGDLTDDTLTYTPDVGFIGTDTFTYTVSDGNSGSDTATVTVTVIAPRNSIVGTSGADTLNGTTGNDAISGLADDDVLSGGAGLDELNGGSGNDILTGGPDADIFVFNDSQVLTFIDQIDEITDFSAGSDVIQLVGFGVTFDDLDTNGDDLLDGNDASVTVDGSGLTFDLTASSGSTLSIELSGVASLAIDDFFFL